jgi:hypothetical protein
VDGSEMKPDASHDARNGTKVGPMTLDEFFSGYEESRRIFDAVRTAIDALGPTELRVTKSQVVFRRRKAFAWVWIPSKYLSGKSAPLVLTLSFRNRNKSPRWKEIVEPTPRRFTHHLELYSATDVDDQARKWLWDARIA